MQGFLFREHVIMCLMARICKRHVFIRVCFKRFYFNVQIEGHTALEPDLGPEHNSDPDPKN
jgi:hypothetical protein